MPKVSIIIGVDRARLNRMVGEIMRSVARVDSSSSLEVASTRLADSGVGVVAITREGRFIGVITDAELAKAFAENADPNSAIENYARDVTWVAPYSTAAEGLRRFVESGAAFLIVVDDDNRPVGLLNSNCFWGTVEERPKPPLVGGMATPFGVYLTNGAVSGGAPQWALPATGAMMFGLFLLGRITITSIATLAKARGNNLPDAALYALELLPVVILLAGFRLLPISGIHAAEHQVVHALERDEPLVPETVARMPRIHPRCGTNIAAATTLFLAISQTPWVPWDDVRLIVAILVTLFFWRPVGSFLQQFLTTKPATRKQIEGGIRAAEELLKNYSISGHSTPGPFRRIWKSGLLHVMAGSLTCYGLFWLLAKLFHLDVSSLL